jgi:heme a synthase
MLQNALKGRSSFVSKSLWAFNGTLTRTPASFRPNPITKYPWSTQSFRHIPALRHFAQIRTYTVGSQTRIYHPRILDTRFFSANSSPLPAADLPVLSPPSVGRWLLVSSALVFAVIVVGGVTRLTESGLSITEWRPITGIIPPTSLAEWDEEFEKYRDTPEFKL